MDAAALLQDSDAGVRRGALAALGRIGEAATSHSAAIAVLLQDEDDYVKYSALGALRDIGGAAVRVHADAITTLLQSLGVRIVALDALESTREAAAAHSAAIAAVIQCAAAALLQYSGPEGTRKIALDALDSIGKQQRQPPMPSQHFCRTQTLV